VTKRDPTAAMPVFAALGDSTRLQLVARPSAEGHQSIAHLTAGGRVTRPSVTNQPQLPAAAGSVSPRRPGSARNLALHCYALAYPNTCLDLVFA